MLKEGCDLMGNSYWYRFAGRTCDSTGNPHWIILFLKDWTLLKWPVLEQKSVRKEQQRQPVMNCTVPILHPPVLPGPEDIKKIGSEVKCRKREGWGGNVFYDVVFTSHYPPLI